MSSQSLPVPPSIPWEVAAPAMSSFIVLAASTSMTVLPSTPAKPVLLASSDSGVFANDGITNVATPTATGPVTFSKAWIEMIHRYLATGVGVLILVLAIVSWLRRRELPVHPAWPLLTLVWVCVQGAFGAFTVTLKLMPAIVTLHLLGGLLLLALLCKQALLYAQADGRLVRREVPRGLRTALVAGFALLWLQVALGGWVSTNYAVLACSDFPTCQGQWWPPMGAQGFALWRELGHAANGQPLPFEALTAIHYAHRSAAYAVLALLGWTGWRLRATSGLARQGQWLLALLALQLITGLSNVVLGWPLLAAVLHTGGASALTVVLVWSLALSRPRGRTTHALPNGRFSNESSRPAA